jgi:hypothetical protein
LNWSDSEGKNSKCVKSTASLLTWLAKESTSAPSLAKCHLLLFTLSGPQPPYVAVDLQVSALARALRPSFP